MASISSITCLGASHEFTFGYMWERESEQQEADGPLGEIVYWFNSPVARRTSPLLTRSRWRMVPPSPMTSSGTRGCISQDQIRIKKRAALTVGFRWDYYRNYEPEETIRDAPFRAFYYGGQPHCRTATRFQPPTRAI